MLGQTLESNTLVLNGDDKKRESRARRAPRAISPRRTASDTNARKVTKPKRPQRAASDFVTTGRSRRDAFTRVASSYRWGKQYTKVGSNREALLEKYKQGSTRVSKALVECRRMDSDPINILCMDGGGMRGYSHMAVLKELQRILGSDCDLMQYFDMTCGTSVGGIAALMQGYHGSNKRSLKDAKFMLDKIRQESFERFSVWNLLKKGSLTTGTDKIAHIVKEYYGNTPLYNRGGLKAFALCTVCDDDHQGDQKFEPFVLRSYDVPDKKKELCLTEDGDGQEEHFEFEVDGTNDVLLHEAMAATSAAPLMTERVDLELNGRKRRAADGCLMSNSPVEIAISEARRLWPKRPLGIILSLGLSGECTKFVSRVVEDARALDSPNLEYLRLIPPIGGFLPTETDPKRIAKMQKVAREHVWSNEKEVKSLLSKLQESGSRTRCFQRSLSPKRKSRQMSAWLAREPVQQKVQGGRRVSVFLRPSLTSQSKQQNRRQTQFLGNGGNAFGSGRAQKLFHEFLDAVRNDPELKQAMKDDTRPTSQHLRYYFSILVAIVVVSSLPLSYQFTVGLQSSMWFLKPIMRTCLRAQRGLAR